MDELEYQQERAALFALGIGIARLNLNPKFEVNPEKALDALDHYCERVRLLSREYYGSLGYTEAQLDLMYKAGD